MEGRRERDMKVRREGEWRDKGRERRGKKRQRWRGE